MPVPKRLTNRDIQSHVVNLLKPAGPGVLQALTDIINTPGVLFNNGKDASSGIRGDPVKNMTALVRSQTGMSEARAQQIVSAMISGKYFPDAEAPSTFTNDLLGTSTEEIAPADFATEEEYRAALLERLGLPQQSTDEVAAAEADKAAAAAAEEAKKKDVRTQMQAFIDSLTGTSAPNDPVRMALTQAGIDAAQKSAGAGGLRGTLAQTQAASVAQQNVLPYEAQRQQLRGQALNSLGNYELSGQQLAQQQAQFDQQRQDIIAENRWKGQQNQGQGLFGTIGAIGGGIIGAYAGGPQGAMAGANIGSSLGGAFSSIGSSQSSPQYSNVRPSSLSRRGSGGNGTGF